MDNSRVHGFCRAMLWRLLVNFGANPLVFPSRSQDSSHSINRCWFYTMITKGKSDCVIFYNYAYWEEKKMFILQNFPGYLPSFHSPGVTTYPRITHSWEEKRRTMIGLVQPSSFTCRDCAVTTFFDHIEINQFLLQRKKV